MKLIVTDLDETLLRFDGTISSYTVDVFNRCREKGILTAFASDRSERDMASMIEALHPDAVISNGGTIVRLRGEIIWECLLAAEETKAILTSIRCFTKGEGWITVETPDGTYCNYTPWNKARRATVTQTDFADFARPAYKITAILRDDSWADEILKDCPFCETVSFTGEDWHRFGPRTGGKAMGVKVLADHVSLPMADVTAFGDDHNDLGMLEIAGVAVAVANAIDEVKEIADYVTAYNDHDGVAKYIEEHILKNGT